MKITGLILLLAGLALSLFLFFDRRPVEDATSGPIVFDVVTIQPRGKHIPKNLMMFADAIAREFKGKIKINFLGGPEVIGPFQQPEAVRSGQIDMALTSSSFYSNLSPLSHVNMFSNQTFDVLQDNGFYDKHEKLHDELGFVYLGEITFDVPFYIFTNFAVELLCTSSANASTSRTSQSVSIGMVRLADADTMRWVSISASACSISSRRMP